MATKCQNCPLRNKPLFTPFTEEDMRYMERFKVGELTVDPGTPILLEGSNSPQLYTALRGMAIRSKGLPNGRRQVVNFVFPGDFIGLQAGVMREMKHSVTASSAMTMCVFDRSEFWNFLIAHPKRAFDMTWLAAVEEHLLGEALTTVGQRTALEAVAWALLRMYTRCEAIGLVRNHSIPLPFKQQDLADALGLSLVHTNKTLGKLRDRQLANWADGQLSIADPEALAAVAEVDITKEQIRPLI